MPFILKILKMFKKEILFEPLIVSDPKEIRISADLNFLLLKRSYETPVECVT